MPDRQAAATLRLHAANVAAVRRQVVTFVEQSWMALGSWRDDDIDRYVRQVVPVVTAGQQQTAVLTAVYLAAHAAATLREPARPAGVPPPGMLRGVPAEDLYRRPAVEMRTALAAGVPFDDALTRGARRAVSLAATDLQLAKTHTARRQMAADRRIVGYRRELTGMASCGLCVVASTQRYRKQDLMPIHPGCDCTVAPIYATRDPGQVIDPARLDAAHGAVEERFGADAAAASAAGYRDLIVQHTHGEIGPVLAVRGHHVRRP